jgi:hypothetical protein
MIWAVKHQRRWLERAEADASQRSLRYRDLYESQYEPMTKLFIAVIERTLQIHGK